MTPKDKSESKEFLKVGEALAQGFLAGVQYSPDATTAFTALGEACLQTAEALGKAVRAAVDCVVAVARGADIAQLLKAAKVQAALNEAPPRVRHLAEHGKKIRTQKKNINRAVKDYERRRRQKRGRT
jgi:hypothetical protein